MLSAAEDALLIGAEHHCPQCRQLLGKTQEDGTVLSLIRRLSHHFANSEIRFTQFGGTLIVECWKCGSDVVFRHSGGTPVV